MLSVDVKNNLGTMLFDSAFAKNDYETHEQKKNADGVPQWTINVLVRQPDSRRSEQMSVTVAMPQDPSTAIEPFTPIAFEGLRLLTGENNGRTWVSFQADKIGRAGGQAK